MPTYRARSCPNCNYYLGFTVARPRVKATELPINGVCLNCGYKVPMHALLLGKKTVAWPAKQRRNRSLVVATAGTNQVYQRSELGLDPPPFPGPCRYATDLRAIGQDLEGRRINHFNLERTGGSYLVWPRLKSPPLAEATSRSAKPGPLRTFWNRISGGDLREAKNRAAVTESPSSERYRYDPADIDRIDRAGQSRRRHGSGITDGHSLSQLLRTLGTLVSQRDQGLVAISWQDVSISVVIEAPQGRRHLAVYRHENIYDFWVKCYLRRANRAYSDVPT